MGTKKMVAHREVEDRLEPDTKELTDEQLKALDERRKGAKVDRTDEGAGPTIKDAIGSAAITLVVAFAAGYVLLFRR